MLRFLSFSFLLVFVVIVTTIKTSAVYGQSFGYVSPFGSHSLSATTTASRAIVEHPISGLIFVAQNVSRSSYVYTTQILVFDLNNIFDSIFDLSSNPVSSATIASADLGIPFPYLALWAGTSAQRPVMFITGSTESRTSCGRILLVPMMNSNADASRAVAWYDSTESGYASFFLACDIFDRNDHSRVICHTYREPGMRPNGTVVGSSLPPVFVFKIDLAGVDGFYPSITVEATAALNQGYVVSMAVAGNYWYSMSARGYQSIYKYDKRTLSFLSSWNTLVIGDAAGTTAMMSANHLISDGTSNLYLTATHSSECKILRFANADAPTDLMPSVRAMLSSGSTLFPTSSSSVAKEQGKTQQQGCNLQHGTVSSDGKFLFVARWSPLPQGSEVLKVQTSDMTVFGDAAGPQNAGSDYGASYFWSAFVAEKSQRVVVLKRGGGEEESKQQNHHHYLGSVFTMFGGGRNVAPNLASAGLDTGLVFCLSCCAIVLVSVVF